MFPHVQQDSVWSEGLRSQAETLRSHEHGSGQQRLPGEQIMGQKCIDHYVMFDKSCRILPSKRASDHQSNPSLHIMDTELTLHHPVFILSTCLSVMVLQRSGCAGDRLYESSGSSKAGTLQPTVLHCIHDHQLQSVGRGGSLDPGQPQQHPAALPCCLLPALCQVLVSEALMHRTATGKCHHQVYDLGW